MQGKRNYGSDYYVLAERHGGKPKTIFTLNKWLNAVKAVNLSQNV